MRAIIVLGAALALTLAAACGSGGGNGDESGLTTVTLFSVNDDQGGGELTVELARTGQDRNRGLMGREELPGDRGMLFVFPADTQAAFWMKDTLIPLSIAFIGEDGTVLDIQDMEPLTTETHHSPQTYRYALEVNQGWFQENGIAVGDRAEIPSEAVATE